MLFTLWSTILQFILVSITFLGCFCGICIECPARERRPFLPLFLETAYLVQFLAFTSQSEKYIWYTGLKVCRMSFINLSKKIPSELYFNGIPEIHKNFVYKIPRNSVKQIRRNSVKNYGILRHSYCYP